MKKLLRTISFVLLFSIFTSNGFAQGVEPPGKPLNGKPQFVSDQLLVRFQPGTGPEQAKQILAEKGLQRLRRIPVLGVDVLQLPPGLTVERAMETLSHRPEVDYAEPNYILTTQVVPVEIQDQWPLIQIEAPAAWDSITNRNPILLGIVDTGIDRNHPDLSANIWEKEAEKNGQPGVDDDGNGFIDDIWGWNFAYGNNDPFDDNLHGTAVSSITAAKDDVDDYGLVGVCPWCQVLAVKVLGADGSGTLDNVANGIIYAADNGARVINLSLAAGIGMPTLEDAVNYAWNQGSLVVAAAGNDGAYTVVYPAAYANVMAIASTNSQDFRSCYSNYSENYISVAAPGEAVTVAVPNGDYGTYSGTSLSAPHVTGLGGLLFSQNPNRSNDDVRALIEGTTNDLGPVGTDAYFGTGRINAYRAVTENATPTDPPAGLFSTDASASGYAHARKLARDAGGGLHLVWHTQNGPQYQVMYATSGDGGMHWSQEVVFESPAETYHPALALVGDRISIAFPSKDNSNLYRILTTSKLLTEVEWSIPEAVMGGSYNAVRPDLYYDVESAKLHLVASSFDDASNVYHSISQDGGLSWGQVHTVNISTGGAEYSRYVDVYANGDNIYLAGRSVELTFFGLIPHFRLFYVFSTNRGISWNPPQVLAEYEPGLFSLGGEYGISLSGFGDDLLLAYEHAGNILFSRRVNGTNWSVPATIGPGAWPSITQNEYGEAWLAWDDAGNINLQHYNGSAWETAESIGGGSYPNLKGNTSGGSVDWVSTQCSGAPFRLSVSSQSLGSNQAPVADPGGPYSGTEDVPMPFDGTGSSDLDGDPLTFTWDFGDGASGNGATPSHTYTYGGTFTVSLTVIDGRGGVDQATTTATVEEVNDPPVPDIGGPYSGVAGSPVVFDGSGSYDPDNQDGTLTNDQTLTYRWDFGDGNSETGINPSHTYTAANDYTVNLTISDGNDESVATTQVKISSANLPPIANDVIVSGYESSIIPWTPLVSDPDGNLLECSIVGTPTRGFASVNPDCTSGQYLPNSGFTGTDTFTYQACEASAGLCSNTATVMVSVNPAPGLHIGDLDAVSYSDKKFWVANVTITVHDENHNPVEGATVSGTWSGQVVDTECATSSNGQCIVSKDGIRKNISSVTFTVNQVTYNSITYQSSHNHDPDGDSDGTVIVVYKP